MRVGRLKEERIGAILRAKKAARHSFAPDRLTLTGAPARNSQTSTMVTREVVTVAD